MTDPSVLTIILNYRTPELTLRSAAAAMREMDGINGEIVIVDNDSRDDSFEMIAATVADPGWNRGSRVRLVQSDHNGGFGAGNNFAMRAGLSNGNQPDFFYLLNSDAFPEPGAIRRLRDFMIAYPKAGLAGSHVRGLNGEPHRTAFRFPSIAGEFEGAARTGIFSRLLAGSIVAIPIPQTDTQVDWVAGASVMMRRRMLDEVGLFDEVFFLYFEETELSYRAARAGWRTHYVPSSEVLHIGSASTGMKTWRRTPGYWFDSRAYYFTKTHGAAYTGLATLARIGGCLIWRLRRLAPSQPLGDPPMFLRDLVAHSLRGLARRKPQPAHGANPGLPIGQTIAEDQK
jgi:GT2 family glycosyltransferase